MCNSKLLTGLVAALGLFGCIATANASAAAVTGQANLMCGSDNVIACADGSCLQGGPETFGLRHYLFVDFQRNIVHGVDENGEEASSPINNTEITENAVILQGFGNDRGWTMGIQRSTGKLTMSSIGVDVNFFIIGNCTER